GRDVQHVTLDIDLADEAALGVLHELGIAHAVLGLGTAVELLEYREQHQRDHHPDRNFGKRIVQGRSPAFAPTATMLRAYGTVTTLSMPHSTLSARATGRLKT